MASKRSNRPPPPAPTPGVQTSAAPTYRALTVLCAGFKHRIERAVPGADALVYPERSGVGVVVGFWASVAGPAGEAAARWPLDGAPDVEAIRRDLAAPLHADPCATCDEEHEAGEVAHAAAE